MANFLGAGGEPEAVGEDAGQGGEIGKKGREGQLFPHSSGTHQEDSSHKAVLCSTQQLGGKWEVGTKLQISFQTPSQACEWI